MAKSAKAYKKPELVTNNSKEDIPDIEMIRSQMALMSTGFVVHVDRITKVLEEEGHWDIHLTLLSEVTRIPVFGDIKLRISRQAASQLKLELARSF